MAVVYANPVRLNEFQDTEGVKWHAVFASIGLLLSIGCATSPKAEPEPTTEVLESEGPRHPVTAKMRDVTERLAAQKAPRFQATDIHGESQSLSSLLKEGPVVMFSVKYGCPCSTDFQPFANIFTKRYSGRATLVGLFDLDQKRAAEWAKKFEVEHVLIADPKFNILKPYKFERSVYVTVVMPDGKVAKSWPGYSKSMLLELDGLLQQATDARLAEFDTQYAPHSLASGCQIFEGEGFAPGDKR